MPRLKIITASNNPVVPILYLIDQAVGMGAPNRRGDVLLVQFMIRILQEQPQKWDGIPFDFRMPGGGVISVDGHCGPQTLKHLANFRAVYDQGAKDSPETMLRDARVDPLVGHSPVGPRTGHVLTILRLNQGVAAAIGRDRFMRLNAEPLFPQEIAGEFYI